MYENIFWTLSCKIKDGELENLKILRDEMVESTKANKVGALNYEWFVSADDRFCSLYERYSDAAAAVVHIKSFGKNYAKRFMEILEVKNFTVYGAASEELINILTPMKAVLMNPFGGFKK